MGIDRYAQMMSATLQLIMYLSLPALAMAAAVGLLVGLLQAVTQVQDQSLPQVLKLVAVLVTVAVLGPALVAPLVRHTEQILDRFPAMEYRR